MPWVCFGGNLFWVTLNLPVHLSPSKFKGVMVALVCFSHLYQDKIKIFQVIFTNERWKLWQSGSGWLRSSLEDPFSLKIPDPEC